MKNDNDKILKIKETMRERNYQEFSCLYDGNLDVLEIEFKSIPEKTYDHVFTCIVYPHESGSHEFEFVELVNPGALLLSTNKCGPLSNDEHFVNQEYFILRALRRLHDNS